jgi:hypothetical protein
MPFLMKIQPIDIDSQARRDPIVRADAAKPVLKLWLKRLFNQQLLGILKILSAKKLSSGKVAQLCRNKLGWDRVVANPFPHLQISLKKSTSKYSNFFSFFILHQSLFINIKLKKKAIQK